MGDVEVKLKNANNNFIIFITLSSGSGSDVSCGGPEVKLDNKANDYLSCGNSVNSNMANC
ncbi:MAG: hypothetical protein ACK518_03265 [bacterium]|jgi:hypothetical protein